MNIKMRPLDEITQRAFDLLYRELGPADTIRFVDQFRTRRGNYTKERKALFGSLTVDDIIGEIKKSHNKNGGIRRRRKPRRGG
jgi:hypothetical protein